MIALRHKTTGEVQHVTSMAGIDNRRWVVVDAATAGIEAARRVQRGIINRGRDAAENAGLATKWGVFDSDAAGRAHIDRAVQSAMIMQALGLPFSIDWTLADNSSVTLDLDAMLGIGLDLARMDDALHQRGRALKGRIDAAATVEAVEAVIWTTEDKA